MFKIKINEKRSILVHPFGTKKPSPLKVFYQIGLEYERPVEVGKNAPHIKKKPSLTKDCGIMYFLPRQSC